MIGLTYLTASLGTPGYRIRVSTRQDPHANNSTSLLNREGSKLADTTSDLSVLLATNEERQLQLQHQSQPSLSQMWPYKPISWDKYYSSGIHESEFPLP